MGVLNSLHTWQHLELSELNFYESGGSEIILNFTLIYFWLLKTSNHSIYQKFMFSFLQTLCSLFWVCFHWFVGLMFYWLKEFLYIWNANCCLYECKYILAVWLLIDWWHFLMSRFSFQLIGFNNLSLDCFWVLF